MGEGEAVTGMGPCPTLPPTPARIPAMPTRTRYRVADLWKAGARLLKEHPEGLTMEHLIALTEQRGWLPDEVDEGARRKNRHREFASQMRRKTRTVRVGGREFQ